MADISVFLTAHNETVVAGPTIHSLQSAIAYAREAGHSVETFIGLDSVTDATKQYFSQPDFSDWEKVELEQRDLGGSRNELIKIAKGDYVAFIDADDLFSENWLSFAASHLEQNCKTYKMIAHPELNWIFDAGPSVLAKCSQLDPMFSPYILTVMNCYDALCMAPKEAFLEVPYRRRDRANGLGYEDWQWNIDTMKEGWVHDVVQDTIIFKRRRDESLLSNLRVSGTLLWSSDPLSVKNTRTLGDLAKK